MRQAFASLHRRSSRRRGARSSRWPLFGMIAAASLAAGGCAGALVGHFAVTGGLHPDGGWQVPSFGAEAHAAELPPPVAVARAVEMPSYVGYYPAQASDVPQPQFAETAARDFDALFDEPVHAEARHPEPTVAEWSESVSGPDAQPAYWDGEADGADAD